MRTVIIGASLAGLRAAEAFRQNDAGHSGEVLLLGAEPHPPYQRPPLSKELLAVDGPMPELTLQPPESFAEQRLTLRASARVEGVDLARRELTLARGERVGFDRLLIATGASPRRLEVPGAELEGIRVLRTLDDALALRAALQLARSVVVVGAGLIGLEVASAARVRGAKVTLIERGPALLQRLLGGARVGDALTRLVEDRGVEVRLSSAVQAFEGRGRVREVVLGGGRRVEADLVVVAAGVTPNTAFLEGTGIAVDDGVLVDASMRTSVPGVFAAGDVARVYLPRYATHVRFEQFGAAAEQGAVAGKTMAGVAASFAGIPGGGTSVFGARVQVSGRVRPGDEAIVRGDVARRSFVAFFVSSGVVHAAFALDRPREFLAARKLVEREAVIEPDALRDEQRPLAA